MMRYLNADKYLSIEMLGSNFPFPQYFQYISNFRNQITYSFVKCNCSIYLFLFLFIYLIYLFFFIFIYLFIFFIFFIFLFFCLILKI